MSISTNVGVSQIMCSPLEVESLATLGSVVKRADFARQKRGTSARALSVLRGRAGAPPPPTSPGETPRPPAPPALQLFPAGISRSGNQSLTDLAAPFPCGTSAR